MNFYVPQMIKKIAFVVYPAVKNFKRTREFYTSTLGLKEGACIEDKHNGVPYVWLEYDLPQGGCLALSDLECAIPKGNATNVAFEVDDIEAILRSLPGEAKKQEVFSTPVCEMAVISDPEGNTITLHRLKRNKRAE